VEVVHTDRNELVIVTNALAYGQIGFWGGVIPQLNIAPDAISEIVAQQDVCPGLQLNIPSLRTDFSIASASSSWNLVLCISQPLLPLKWDHILLHSQPSVLSLLDFVIVASWWSCKTFSEILRARRCRSYLCISGLAKKNPWRLFGSLSLSFFQLASNDCGRLENFLLHLHLLKLTVMCL
jgi:hypothetical protein